ALVAGGCRSAEDYRAAADREVYAILADRRAEFVADPASFTIDAPEDSLRRRILAAEPLPYESLDLVDCLAVAAENNRAFQARREQLYLTALDLTFERYEYQVQSQGVLAASLFGDAAGETSVASDATLGLSKLLGTGALIVGDIGLSMFRSITSSGTSTPSSNVALSITQPLLRGFGKDIVLEPLTQAERDVLYEVRSYERFRRTLAFDVVQDVYVILGQGDVLANERANYDSLVDVRLRNEARARAGRLSEIEVDQARDQELRARSSVIDAEQQLAELYDGFFFFLGLPIDTPLVVDPVVLEELVAAGLEDVDLDEEQALRVALHGRLDLVTAWDQVQDAGRRAAIAADALRPGLSLLIAADAQSVEGKPFDYRGEDLNWEVGFAFHLPIDRLVERNVYRSRLIELEQARREAEELEEQITIEVRDSLRQLTSRREDYLIQTNSVALNERRVENVNLNLEAGRAQTRDLLEAQQSLVESQNSLISALVQYRLAVLALYRDLELLTFDEHGVGLDRERLAELLAAPADAASDAAAEPPAPQPADLP
ncbi:MAG TPA: TolC family protein, partial [Planctomycetota bacterium]|nr:TolC family protein [Planctomycetota bacterium]